MRTAPIDGYVQTKEINIIEHSFNTTEYVINPIQRVINDTKTLGSSYRWIDYICKMSR